MTILQAAYPIGTVSKYRDLANMDAVFAAFGTREAVEQCKAKMRPGGKAWLSINVGVVDPVARAGTWARKAYDLAEMMGLISPYLAMGRPMIWLRHPRTLAYLTDIGQIIGERDAPELYAAHGVAIDYCAWQDAQRSNLGISSSWTLTRQYGYIQDALMWTFLSGLGDVPYGLNSYGDSKTQPDSLGVCSQFKFETFSNMNTTVRGEGVARLDREIDLARGALVRKQAVTFQVCPRDHWDESERDQHVAACAAIFGGLHPLWPELAYWSCDTTKGVTNGAPGVAYTPNPLALAWREQVDRMFNAPDRVVIYTRDRGTWRVEVDGVDRPLRLVAE